MGPSESQDLRSPSLIMAPDYIAFYYAPPSVPSGYHSLSRLWREMA